MLLNRLAGLKKMMTGEEPAAPIAQLLGIEIVEVETGLAVLEMEASEEFLEKMTISAA